MSEVDERTAPCRKCRKTVVKEDGVWVHTGTGSRYCRSDVAEPDPPHRCGSRDGLSGCWHPSHGGNL